MDIRITARDPNNWAESLLDVWINGVAYGPAKTLEEAWRIIEDWVEANTPKAPGV